MTLYRQVVLAVTSLSLHLCWEPLCSLLGKRWLIWQLLSLDGVTQVCTATCKDWGCDCYRRNTPCDYARCCFRLACCLTLTPSISRGDRSFIIDKSHKDPFLGQFWSCQIFFVIFLTWMMSIEKVWLLIKSFCLSNLGHEDPIAEAATA